jgi:peptide chain release factor 1
MLPDDKLQALRARYHDLTDLLCQPNIAADGSRYTALSRERAEMEPLVESYERYQKLSKQIADDRDALKDPELRDMVLEELPGLERAIVELEAHISVLLLPTDPNDARNTLLEIRSGTGGEEAALFAADLFRMYGRYAERRGFRLEVMSTSPSEHGGIKEIIALVTGARVYSELRFEGGVHRVQRVPATEAQGRIHTSTATVAVLPEAEEVDVAIDEKDLKVDIAASGGPGGQGVNTTNSAVQITHLPTGMIVKCQDERSQLKNRAKAMKVLRSRLLDIEQQKQADSIRDERRGMVGGGDRSEKIRTYNFPQNRLTDHRIGLTLYKLDRVMEGDLSELLDAVVAHYQAALLEANRPSGEGP